jgi:hypothetical protein
MRIVIFVVLGVLVTVVFAVVAAQAGDPRNALAGDMKKSMVELKTRVAEMRARGASPAEIKAEMMATRAKVWGEAYALAAEKAKERLLR